MADSPSTSNFTNHLQHQSRQQQQNFDLDKILSQPTDPQLINLQQQLNRSSNIHQPQYRQQQASIASGKQLQYRQQTSMPLGGQPPPPVHHPQYPSTVSAGGRGSRSTVIHVPARPVPLSKMTERGRAKVVSQGFASQPTSAATSRGARGGGQEPLSYTTAGGNNGVQNGGQNEAQNESQNGAQNGGQNEAQNEGQNEGQNGGQGKIPKSRGSIHNPEKMETR